MAVDLVTLRAVEKFEQAVPLAARLLKHGGRLALLIGASQLDAAKGLLAGFGTITAALPGSRERMLLIARTNQT